MSDTDTHQADGHQADPHQAAWLYLQAARETGPGARFPDALRPRREADAYAIQRLALDALGPIGGWKVGAAGPDAPITCAPMPESGLHDSPAVLASAAFTSREIESEIAFVLGRDLPPRAHIYTPAEVHAVLATCHGGLEVLQSRFADPEEVDGPVYPRLAGDRFQHAGGAADHCGRDHQTHRQSGRRHAAAGDVARQ